MTYAFLQAVPQITGIWGKVLVSAVIASGWPYPPWEVLGRQVGNERQHMHLQALCQLPGRLANTSEASDPQDALVNLDAELILARPSSIAGASLSSPSQPMTDPNPDQPGKKGG